MLHHGVGRTGLVSRFLRQRFRWLPRDSSSSPSSAPSLIRFNSNSPTPPDRDRLTALKTPSKPLFDKSIYSIPNLLTYTRIIATPFIGYHIACGSSTVAMSLFTYSCITDYVDGYIARKFNMKSVVGSIIDPLADKLLMTVTTLSLAYVHAIPPAIASIIIGRDVLLSSMATYYRIKSLPKPRTFDKFVSIGQVPTISVHPNLLGKVNTALQMLYIGGLVYRPLLDNSGMAVDVAFDALGLIVGATTLLSGASYVFGKNSWKYVK
ncbi:uncharacterized protein LODBEIA_P29610 [Lodderomyces beijingensis]|uniref:Cardiolipin synthase n=1 Tax=Lodderomyces beijingensis TaxID=1775926 RepID=A0ABP0ZMY6_9ASCO